MADIADNIEWKRDGACSCDTCPDDKIACAENIPCDGETCACEYIGVDLRSPTEAETEERLERLEAARAQFEREYREELARLQKRVAELEEQGRAHASRQICALMTEIDSLERNVLGRDVTTSQAKKKGLEILGVDKGK